MKYVIILLIALASTFTNGVVQAQDEPCTLTHTGNGLWVAEGDCNFREAMEGGFKIEMNGQVLTGIITSFRPLEVVERVEEETACSNELTIGETAVVNTTDGDELNSRINPGTDYDIVHTIPDGETVTIVSGPIESDGYTWWQVRYNSLRSWSVESADEISTLIPCGLAE